jgi:hypothetical protein
VAKASSSKRAEPIILSSDEGEKSESESEVPVKKRGKGKGTAESTAKGNAKAVY